MPCFEDDLHATPQTEELEQERKGGKESGNKRLGKGGKKKKTTRKQPLFNPIIASRACHSRPVLDLLADFYRKMTARYSTKMTSTVQIGRLSGRYQGNSHQSRSSCCALLIYA